MLFLNDRETGKKDADTPKKKNKYANQKHKITEKIRAFNMRMRNNNTACSQKRSPMVVV